MTGTCTNVSINFGATFFWTLTFIIAGSCSFISWQLSLYYRNWREAKELQRRIDWTNRAPHIAVDDRKPRYRFTDPEGTLLRLKRPEERAAVKPEEFDGWRKLDDYWYKVAAE